jgi:hypothetical protein
LPVRCNAAPPGPVELPSRPEPQILCLCLANCVARPRFVDNIANSVCHLDVRVVNRYRASRPQLDAKPPAEAKGNPSLKRVAYDTGVVRMALHGLDDVGLPGKTPPAAIMAMRKLAVSSSHRGRVGVWRGWR